MPAEVYASKIDTWLLVLLIGSALVALIAAAVAVASDPRRWPLALFVIAIGVVLPVWLLATTRYVLEGDHLTILSGPFQWRMPVADITSVTPTRSPVSSPALSLDRLRIEYDHGRAVMISPADKDGFVRALAV